MNNNGHDKTPPTPSSAEVVLNVRIDRICEEFESLLKAGKTPRIETYLAELPQKYRGTLLEELLGLELDYRTKAGDSFSSDEYTLRFPEHASSVAELVLSVRGQQPDDNRTQDSRPRQTPPATKASNSSQATHKSHVAGSPVRIGPYEIIEPCGRGGMGVVYKAWHELFKQYRAIKVLPSNFDDDDISRFSMEIELAGRLNHPNIVRAHEANREQGILYLVMEFVDGINLDHLVKHHKQLPLGLACEMIRQAAEGLQHAHEHFLVHRDIKPSNLMVNQQGQIKILDFGLARLHAEQNASRLTKHGSVMGTLDFMAPEQWEDPMGATIQADIYSLGCTLYYLVTGTPPYGGEDYSHWIKKQEAHRKQPVPQIEHEQGAALQPIINRMMAKSTKERFQTPVEVVRALEALADPSELKRYAETPVPQLSTSGISRTPIPTVNLEGGVLGQLAERFSPDDSEVNSKEKTIRPNQSRTDLDSDRPQIQTEAVPAKPAWYQTRAWKSSMLVLVFVLLFSAWTLLRPPQNVELAEQMGALPGLNGGLNGDWWFAEMPWYGPGVRKAFMDAIRNGEREIAGVRLDELEARIRDADTETLHGDLRAIVEELISRLPDREHLWAGQILVPKRSAPEYDTRLLNILPEPFNTEAKLDQETVKATRATELHFVANILHWASTSNSKFAPKTQQIYDAAITAYDQNDPVEKVLLAVALSDYSRFLSSRRDYTKSITYAKRAADAVPKAMLFQISLYCDLADQFRRLDGDPNNALVQLASAESWAEEMDLAHKHPLQAEMLERRAWIHVDGWQMNKAIDEFKAATKIRQTNQERGNTFAWRPILLNLQGQAMALHFLGQDQYETDLEGNGSDGAIAIYNQLIAMIDDPPPGLPYGTKPERRERRPNVFERQGDAFLFGPNPDPVQAADSFDKAIWESIQQEFGNSATLWFHLTRMYHKHTLALSMSGNLARDMKKIQSNQDDARDLENTFREQMANDPKAFEKQRAAFALEQQVAVAVLNLKQAEAGNVTNELEQLHTLIRDTEKSQVSRSNIEVLLLVFQLLFEHADELETSVLRMLGGKFLTFTDAMRNGDPAIRTRYLQPVFNISTQAVPELKRQLEEATRDVE